MEGVEEGGRVGVGMGGAGLAGGEGAEPEHGGERRVHVRACETERWGV